jgi:hypothetical protein
MQCLSVVFYADLFLIGEFMKFNRQALLKTTGFSKVGLSIDGLESEITQRQKLARHCADLRRQSECG